MTLERGGLNLPLLEELVTAGAPSAVLRSEGFTEAETIRAKIVSALRTTSDAVNIGPAYAANNSGLSDRQPRREVAAGTTPSGFHDALEREPGTTVAPRGDAAGHSRTTTRSKPD